MRKFNIFKKVAATDPVKDWTIKPEHQVEFAFKGIDGTEYYQFTTGYNSYYERYMAFMDRLSEIEQRVDKNYLDRFQKTLDEYLNKGSLKDIAVLNKHLADRRAYIGNVELIYNLASVWFFDKSENPYTYDYGYADEKIRKWRNDKDSICFFLTTPLRHYLPLPDTLVQNIKTYEKGQYVSELQTLKHHLQALSSLTKNTELISTYQLRVTELEQLVSQM